MMIYFFGVSIWVDEDIASTSVCEREDDRLDHLFFNIPHESEFFFLQNWF